MNSKWPWRLQGQRCQICLLGAEFFKATLFLIYGQSFELQVISRHLHKMTPKYHWTLWGQMHSICQWCVLLVPPGIVERGMGHMRRENRKLRDNAYPCCHLPEDRRVCKQACRPVAVTGKVAAFVLPLTAVIATENAVEWVFSASQKIWKGMTLLITVCFI